MRMTSSETCARDTAGASPSSAANASAFKPVLISVLPWGCLSCPAAQFLQARQQVFGEERRVLREGEMADARHHPEPRALDLRGRRGGMLGGAGVVVLAGQHEERAARRIDPVHAVPRIPFAGVEVDVAGEGGM